MLLKNDVKFVYFFPVSLFGIHMWVEFATNNSDFYRYGAKYHQSLRVWERKLEVIMHANVTILLRKCALNIERLNIITECVLHLVKLMFLAWEL